MYGSESFRRISDVNGRQQVGECFMENIKVLDPRAYTVSCGLSYHPQLLNTPTETITHVQHLVYYLSKCNILCIYNLFTRFYQDERRCGLVSQIALTARASFWRYAIIVEALIKGSRCIDI